MHIVRSSFSSNYEQNYIRGPITQIKSSVHWCQEWRVRLPRISSRKTCFSCLRISRKWNIGRIGDSGEREKMHIKDYEITCSLILSSHPCCTYTYNTKFGEKWSMSIVWEWHLQSKTIWNLLMISELCFLGVSWNLYTFWSREFLRKMCWLHENIFWLPFGCD